MPSGISELFFEVQKITGSNGKIKAEKMCCLDLLQTKEFLDIFEQSSKLDFALFSMTGNADNLYQSYISRRSIGERRKNEIIAKNISSFPFEHSFVASGLIEIQKNKKP